MESDQKIFLSIEYCWATSIQVSGKTAEKTICANRKIGSL
jgi:hypothetical protein